MTDQRTYDVFLTNPAHGSKYEFFLFGFARVFDGPPLWALPVEITGDLSPKEAAYRRRWNELDACLKSGAVQRLRESGMPEELLQEPLSERVGPLVAELVTGARLTLRQSELQAPPAPPAFDLAGGTYERGLCARVVAAAVLCVGGRSFGKTAEFLNTDRSADAKGLTRYHVGRAFKAQEQRLLRIARIAGLDAALVCSTFELAFLNALDIIHGQARKSGEFGRLRGAELAAAIHDGHDLRECVLRRLDAWRTSGGWPMLPSGCAKHPTGPLTSFARA